MTTHLISRQAHFSRAWAFALASLTLSASAVAAQAGATQATVSEVAPQSLSRAEVIADFKLWRRSGADQYAEAAHYYQVDEAAYARALAEYRRLRNGPAFAQELARVLGEGQASAHADAR